MRTTWTLTLALLFVPLCGYAEPADPAPLTSQALAAILAQPVDAGCGAIAQSGPAPVAMASSQTKALCTATATCESGTVSCQSNVSATSCTAVDRDCSWYQRGYVTCNGVTTQCPTSCCNSGTPRQRQCCYCAETGECLSCYICENGFVLYPGVCSEG